MKNLVAKWVLIGCSSCVALMGWTAESKEEVTTPPLVTESEDSSLYKQGDVAFALGDIDRAIECYQRYIMLSSVQGESNDVRRGVVRLINLYLKSNQPEKANEVLAGLKAQMVEGDNYFPQTLEAEILLVKGEYATAIELLKALKADENLPEYLKSGVDWSLAEALFFNKNYLESAKVYNAIEDFSAKVKSIMALQMANELIDSQSALTKLAEAKLNSEQKLDIELLKVNQAIQEKRFIEAGKIFLELPEETNPNSWRYQLASTLAKHYTELRQSGDAVMFFRSAYATAPTIEERKFALSNLIDCEAKVGNFDQAVVLMRRYLESYATGADYDLNMMELAHMLTKQKQLQGSAICYNELINSDNAKLSLKLQAAREASAVYMALGMVDEAATMLQFLIANADSATLACEGRLLLAEIRFEKEDYIATIQLTGAASLENTKWRFPALYLQLKAQEKLEQYGEALKTAQYLKNKGIESWPSIGAFAEARLLELSGDVEGAINAYANYAALWNFTNNAPTALYAAGKLAFSYGDFGRATELFRGLTDRYPRYELSDHGLYLAIYSEYLQGRQHDMNELIELIYQRYPESSYTKDALFWQLDQLKLTKDYVGAEQLINKMLNIYKDSPEAVRLAIIFEQASLLKLTGKTEEALALFKQISESKETDCNWLIAKSYFTQGDILISFGRYEEAESCFTKANLLAPDQEFYLATQGRLADTYYARGSENSDQTMLKMAGEGYKRVLDEVKKDGLIYYQSSYKLARVDELMGNSESAIKIYNEMILAASIEPATVSTNETVWIEKAVVGLVNLYINEGSMASLERASKVIELVESLKLPAGSKFIELKNLIKSKYEL